MASSPFIYFNIIFLMILLLPSNTVAAPPSLTSATVAAPSSLTLDLTTSIRYDDLNFNVVLKGITYLMMLFVGTPEPQQILVNVDTSNDVMWTLCNPASKEANFHEFDPKSSWSFSPISCYDAVSCSKDLPNRHCGNHSTYDYTLDYGFDNSATSKGVFSSETFIFSSDSANVSILKVLFGCSIERKGNFGLYGSSVVGLGRGRLSLTSQLRWLINSKFSYCLVALGSNSTSKQHFRDKATVGLASDEGSVIQTHILEGETPSLYYLQLDEIIVGDYEKVLVPTNRTRGGNIIIDSGSTFTSLDESVFRPVADKLSKIVKYPIMGDKSGIFEVCFNVSSSSSTKSPLELPDITFGFSGAPIKLPSSNLFIPTEEGTMCLAVKVVSKNGFPILGNLEQQNLHIGYDLNENMLSVAHADCAKML